MPTHSLDNVTGRRDAAKVHILSFVCFVSGDVDVAFASCFRKATSWTTGARIQHSRIYIEAKIRWREAEKTRDEQTLGSSIQISRRSRIHLLPDMV
jgi:hypothetical protein